MPRTQEQYQGSLSNDRADLTQLILLIIHSLFKIFATETFPLLFSHLKLKTMETHREVQFILLKSLLMVTQVVAMSAGQKLKWDFWD